MNAHKPVLLKSLNIIKPNFHAFTARFHTKLAKSDLSMDRLTSEEFSEKSYILYCTLERIIKNVDKPATVAPFLTHNLQFLVKSNLQRSDLVVLCDIFYLTLVEHLGHFFDEESHQAWKKFLKFFENFANHALFDVSNVIAFPSPLNTQHSNEI